MDSLDHLSACHVMRRWKELLQLCIGMQRCHTDLLGLWNVLLQDKWQGLKHWTPSDRAALQSAIGTLQPRRYSCSVVAF